MAMISVKTSSFWGLCDCNCGQISCIYLQFPPTSRITMKSKPPFKTLVASYTSERGT